MILSNIIKGDLKMIDVKENELLNAKLDTLYKKYTSDFLDEWEKSFSEWIKESKEEVPYRMNEFGIVNIQNYDKDNGVLFVAKETNNWENKDFKSGCLFRGWLSNIVEQGYIGQGVKPNMWYNVGRWMLLIENPDRDIKEIASAKQEAIGAIGRIAFTNVNKVRGKKSSETEYNQLAKTAVVGDVLRQEIKILNPQIIVCCGTKWVLDKHIENFNGKILDMPHPGARLSTEKMLLRLREQL